jgi:hypothetical protein
VHLVFFAGIRFFFDERPLEVQPMIEDKNLSICLRWNNILLIYIMRRSILCITLIRRLSHSSTYVIFLICIVIIFMCNAFANSELSGQEPATTGLLQGTLRSGRVAAPARLVLAGVRSFISNDICLCAAANLCFYILQI